MILLKLNNRVKSVNRTSRTLTNFFSLELTSKIRWKYSPRDQSCITKRFLSTYDIIFKNVPFKRSTSSVGVANFYHTEERISRMRTSKCPRCISFMGKKRYMI